ncbi:MAG TPA: CHAP domain-containing protein [Acetobacteraceae bacterium]|nr:CHAP domain-containing protein [Acetobacteraceae bacterium]
MGAILSLSALSAHDALASAPASKRPARHANVHHVVFAHHGGNAHHAGVAHHGVFAHRAAHAGYHTVWTVGHGRFASRHGRLVGRTWHVVARGISCVPFARSDSGIALSGNAWEWWDHAAGVYARGHVPEPGSVLAFRANPRMRLGHVAVVSRIINRREVEIDQANWWGAGLRGGVSRNVPVVDVSEANDWSAVRVGLGGSGEFGAVYPTYGFIYDRPDSGVMVAAAQAPAPQPMLNPAPRDLRPVAERPWQTYEQVAEAPAQPIDAAARPAEAWAPATVSAAAPSSGGLVGAIDRK